MAIAYDTLTASTVSSASSKTVSHTCSGSDRLLFVFGYVEGGKTMTATYAGNAMTELAYRDMNYSPNHRLYLFYQTNPASGANDIVTTNSGSAYTWCAGMSYTGAAQSSPIDVSGSTNSSASTTVNIPLTLTTSDGWIICCSWHDNGGSLAGELDTATTRGTLNGAAIFVDSNGTKASGSRTARTTAATGGTVGIAAAFKIATVATSVKDMIGSGFIPYAR